MAGPIDAAEREARIAEIRRQIAEGVYDTSDKLEAALDAFLDSRERTGETEQSKPTRKAVKPR